MPGAISLLLKCGDYREAVGKINNMKVVCTMKKPVCMRRFGWPPGDPQK
jgi:hypothetical protein